MKTIPIPRALLFAALLLLSLAHSHALTPQEQARAFLARAAAAEKRGDLVAAANCYDLALRIDGGNAAAQTAKAEIEKKMPAHLLEQVMAATVEGGFRDYKLVDAVDSLVVRYRTSRWPNPFEIQDATGSLSKVRVSYSSWPHQATVAEILKSICDSAGAQYTTANGKIVITPKNAPAAAPVAAIAKTPALPMAPAATASTPAKAGTTGKPTPASPSASHCCVSDTVAALNDGKRPSSSEDALIPRFTWRPRKGTFEWVEYRFATPQTVEGSSVYWYQDNSQVKLPHYWKMLYLAEDGAWMPVDTQPGPPALNEWNTSLFTPVKTMGLRIAAQFTGDRSAGILEWEVLFSSAKAVAGSSFPLELRLDDLIPTAQRVGFGSYRVNRYAKAAEDRGARILVGGNTCQHFLFAHAPSEVSFEVPPGYSKFTAVGIAPTQASRRNFSWNYQVLADGREVFRSENLGTYPNHEVKIEAELPVGTKMITLKTDNAGNTTDDHSIWAEPKLLASPVSAETKAKLAQLEAWHQAACAKIEPSFVQAIQAVRAKHLAAVQRGSEVAQRASDQAGFGALQEEMRLLKSGQPIPEADAAGMVAALATLRAGYRAGAKAAAAQRAAQLKPIYDQYDAALATLAGSLAGKSADVAAVNAVRTQLAATRQNGSGPEPPAK